MGKFGYTLSINGNFLRSGQNLSIVYTCRHCGHIIGRLEEQVYSTSTLGIDCLTEQERVKMIEHKENGDVHIKAICENCETSLTEHPDYYELEYFIQ